MDTSKAIVMTEEDPASEEATIGEIKVEKARKADGPHKKKVAEGAGGGAVKEKGGASKKDACVAGGGAQEGGRVGGAGGKRYWSGGKVKVVKTGGRAKEGRKEGAKEERGGAHWKKEEKVKVSRTGGGAQEGRRVGGATEARGRAQGEEQQQRKVVAGAVGGRAQERREEGAMVAWGGAQGKKEQGEKEAKEAGGGAEEGSGGATKEERRAVDDPWAWSPDHLETVLGPDIADTVSPLVAVGVSKARATGGSLVLRALAGETATAVVIGPATAKCAAVVIVVATADHQITASVVLEDAAVAEALRARVHALSSRARADDARPLTLSSAAAALVEQEEEEHMEPSAVVVEEQQPAVVGACTASSPAKPQPFEKPVGAIEKWVEESKVELQQLQQLQHAQHNPPAFPDGFAPHSTSTPKRRKLQQPKRPSKRRSGEEKEAELTPPQPQQLQQLQPSQPGLDASFDAWCAAMSAPTPTPTAAKRAASPKARDGAKKRKVELQQLQQPQQAPAVVPAWFDPPSTSTPKRAKAKTVRPSARRSIRGIIVAAPSTSADEDSTIFDEEEFTFVDGPPSSPSADSLFQENNVVGMHDDADDSAPPSSQQSQPMSSSARRSDRRRRRSSSDELESEDFWRVDEEFWRKVHAKRAKHVEAKREECSEAPTRNAPEITAPVVQPRDLAADSLKCSDLLGGFMAGGRKLSKGAWTAPTGRVCADLATAWRSMAVQLGIRRAAIQKGACRALPRMADAVNGSRDHALQHEAFNAASTAVVDSYQALCEMAKLFASEVTKALKETRTRVQYSPELQRANAAFKAAAALQLAEIRTWQAKCEALPDC